MLLLLAAVSIAAVAAVPTARAAGEPDLLSALRGKGAQVVPLGDRGGLSGYFVTPAGGAGYSLYLTASGHAVAGLLYGPDGALITEDQLAAAGADARSEASAAMSGRAAPDGSAHAGIEGGGPQFPPVHSSRADLFERSAAAFGFTLGDRGPPVVLFGDVLCPWSRSAVARLGREALAGRLQLRVVPVAILGAAAARRAAGIAASPDPAQAWFEDAERPAGARGAEEIAWNNALFDAWGERSVPLIVWRGPDGAVGHRVGDIADTGAWLRETLGPDTLRVGDGLE